MMYTKLNKWASCIVLLAIATLPLQAYSKDWKTGGKAIAPTACESDTLMVSVTTDGDADKPLINETLTATFIGRITDVGAVNGKRSRVIVCPGTKVDYSIESAFSEHAACRLDGMHVAASGQIAVGTTPRKLICNNKPEGMDKDKYLIVPAGGGKGMQ